LASGALVQLGPGQTPADQAYYLVWPLTRASHAPLAVFRTWLRAQTAPLRG